jgi:multidrug efflux pump subunit AcrA (membrane-fusion protein)
MVTNRAAVMWRQVWMFLATAGLGMMIVWLAKPVESPTNEPRPQAQPVLEAVRMEPDGTIAIADDSPLQTHLTRLRVERQRVRFPTLTVSGSIVARIIDGSGPLADRWQFGSGEMAGKYADWLKTGSEIEFARNQLEKTQELVAAQTAYLATNSRQMERAMKSGSVPEKEFRAAHEELIKAQLQGEKDIFSARSEVRLAMQAKTALERDLAQGGIEAVVFEHAVENMVLITANVPETKISQFREGQLCEIRFFAYPDRPFEARIKRLSALLTHERRTVHALFELTDPDGILRPGMFAEVGLGTDEREALLIPAEALLHARMDDYVVAAAEGGKWKPVPVRVGEQHQGAFEVEQGLGEGATIITRGAILLKPALNQALSRAGGEKK